MLDILARTQLGVACLHGINDAYRYTDTKYKRHQVYHLRNWLVWSLASVRAADNLYILSGKGTRELVLLLLLEQEQIKLLLDSLLATMSTQIIYLLRIRGHILVVGSFLLVKIGKRLFKSIHLVIKRRHDTSAYGRYLGVELNHHRVGHRTVVNQ